MIGTKTTPRTDRYLSGIPFQRTEPIPDINIGNRSVLGVLEDRPNESTESIGNSTIVEPNRPKPANLPVRSGSGIGSGLTEWQLCPSPRPKLLQGHDQLNIRRRYCRR